MKNLSIFEPQIKKNHAYKKKHVIICIDVHISNTKYYEWSTIVKSSDKKKYRSERNILSFCSE